MIRLAQIIGATVNDNGAAQDALRTNELDQLVRHRALAIALPVRLEVAQIADVALRVRGRAMGLVVGVDCAEKKG